MRLGASAPNLTVCSLSSVGSEHLVYTERVTGSSPVGTTMKKLLFIFPLLFNSCVTQSDYINLAVTGVLLTTSMQVEDWYLAHEARMDSLRPIRQARRDSIRAPKIARRDSLKQLKLEKKLNKNK